MCKWAPCDWKESGNMTDAAIKRGIKECGGGVYSEIALTFGVKY
jgi:hypothetical protein